jgi:hypothetical protein
MRTLNDKMYSYQGDSEALAAKDQTIQELRETIEVKVFL